MMILSEIMTISMEIMMKIVMMTTMMENPMEDIYPENYIVVKHMIMKILKPTKICLKVKTY